MPHHANPALPVFSLFLIAIMPSASIARDTQPFLNDGICIVNITLDMSTVHKNCQVKMKAC